MDIQDFLIAMDREWVPNSGFLAQLRDGHFDKVAFERLLNLLEQIMPSDEALLDRRLVSWTWFIPSFILIKRDLVQIKGGDIIELERAASRISQMLQSLLGFMD